MEQYIPKSALVAEIERLKERFIAFHHRDGIDWPLDNYGKMRAYNEVLSFLDTLEVKECDNVWHDASETPKGAGDKEILVQFSDWHTSVLEIDDWEYLDHQTKWAYLKDLI